MEERTMRFHAVEVTVGLPSVTVIPGGAATVPFRVVNRSGRDDYFEITVRGIPGTWVMTDPPVLYLKMEETREASLTVRPPAGMSGSSGVTSVAVLLTSQSDPTLNGEGNFELFVAGGQETATQTLPVGSATQTIPAASVPAAQRFRSDLSPRQASAGSSARVRIQNLGMQPASFTLMWKAPKDELDVAPSTTDPVMVQPGETAAVDFALSPRSPHWFGGPVSIPYTVMIRSTDGSSATHDGEVISRALIPVWVLPALLVLCLTALCGVGFLWNWNQNRLDGTSVTQTAIVDLANQTTATAVYNQTAAALQGQEDSDGDGLTNSQENELGTNAQSADSDGDRLPDGDEVRLGTNPLNPDTDQDGIVDGQDINPLDANNPSLTATAAAAQPPTATAEPTTTTTPPPTETPVPATATAEPTATQVTLPVTGPGLILFASDRDGDPELYVLNLSDAQTIRLTNSAGSDIEPAWSPDGSRIAFTSARDGNNEIYVVNVDGTGFTNISSNPADDSQPAWSPDGQFIVFSTDRDGNDEIYRMGADGSVPENLTNHPASDSQPDWYSPDGTSLDDSRILFTTDRDGNAEIYAMDPDGDNLDNLTRSESNDTSARMRSDTARIIFVSDRDGNTEIYRMDPDGDNHRNFSNSPSADTLPDWSPDGDWIVFVSDRDGNAEIYVMQSDAENTSKLITSPAADQYPAWR